VRDNRPNRIHRIAPEVPGFEVTAQMALVRMRDRTLDCSTRVRTKLIMHRVVKKPTPESDALIVKAYMMSAPRTRLVVPIDFVLTTADESKMW
jgi:hypothetical protein